MLKQMDPESDPLLLPGTPWSILPVKHIENYVVFVWFLEQVILSKLACDASGKALSVKYSDIIGRDLAMWDIIV